MELQEKNFLHFDRTMSGIHDTVQFILLYFFFNEKKKNFVNPSAPGQDKSVPKSFQTHFTHIPSDPRNFSFSPKSVTFHAFSRQLVFIL